MLLYLTRPFDPDWWPFIVEAYLIPSMVVIAFGAIVWGLRGIDGRRQRRFWQLWAIAMGVWLSIQLAYSFPPDVDGKVLALGIESAVAAFYVCILCALSLHPQRIVERGDDYVGRRFKNVAISVFVFALVLYFAVLTSTLQPELYDSWTPSLTLYVVLDALVFVRLVYLRWHTASPRWAALYTGLAITAFLWTATDLFDVLAVAGLAPAPGWGTGVFDWVWFLPYSALIVTVRMRDLPFPAAEVDVPPPFSKRTRKPWSGVLVGCAVGLPLLHMALSLGRVTDPALHDAREVLVFLAVLVLGGLALAYQRILERANRRMEEDQRVRDTERMEAQVVAAKLHERTLAEAEQRRAKEYFLSIYENATFGIFLGTEKGRFLDANPAMVQMLGYASAEELLVSEPEAIYPEARHHCQLMEANSKGGTFKDVEVDWLCRDSSEITVRLNGRATQLDGRRVFVTIAQDITDERALEEQLRQTQKMEAIGRLAGGLAHDFNNLLTVIIGHAEMWLSDSDGPDDQTDAKEILSASHRAAALTRQLLTFSRQQVPHTRVIEVNELVEDLEMMLARLIGVTVVFETEFEPDLPPVEADSGQLEQVVVNLVVNARDAMPTGGKITMRTSTRRLDAGNTWGLEPGDYVAISVSDTGIGMDEATRIRVFEPFFTTKEIGQGTGLGLFTTYAIVEHAGGSVRVDSAPGDGTTFEVLLPRSLRPPVPVGTGEPATTGESWGDATVLVVEDEEPVRNVVVRALQEVGYYVLLAPGPKQALDMARTSARPIDLLVTDVVMPGMNGVDLAARLTEKRPEMKTLFMSGYPGSDLDLAGSSEDPAAFLGKPFTPAELTSRVAELLLDPVP